MLGHCTPSAVARRQMPLSEDLCSLKSLDNARPPCGGNRSTTRPRVEITATSGARAPQGTLDPVLTRGSCLVGHRRRPAPTHCCPTSCAVLGAIQGAVEPTNWTPSTHPNGRRRRHRCGRLAPTVAAAAAPRRGPGRTSRMTRMARLVRGRNVWR